MRSDSKRLDEGELIQVQRARAMQLPRWHRNQRAHAAVGVNPETFQFSTAIRLPATTRDAVSTIQIRLDGTPIARLQTVRFVARIHDFNPKFVAKNARVFKKRLPPRK